MSAFTFTSIVATVVLVLLSIYFYFSYESEKEFEEIGQRLGTLIMTLEDLEKVVERKKI